MVEKILKIAKILSNLERFYMVKKDGNKLYFVSDRDGKMKLYERDLKNNKDEKIADIEVYNIFSSKYSKRIIIGEDVGKGEEKMLLWEYNPEKKEIKNLGNKPYRIFSVVFDDEKIVFDENREDGIYWILKKDNEFKILKRFERVTFFTDIKGEIVCGNFLNEKGEPKVFLFDLKTLDFKEIEPFKDFSYGAPFFYKENLIFSYFYEDKEDILIYDFKNDKYENLKLESEEWKGYREYYYKYDEKSEKIFIIGRKEGKSFLFVDGKKCDIKEGNIWDMEISDGEVYGYISSFTIPPKICKVYPEFKEIFGINIPKWMKNKLKFLEFKYIESFDGLKIPTFIIRKSKKPLPSIVWVHGGPWDDERDEFMGIILGFLCMGYNVIIPNFRGSTGYGENFRKMDIGDIGGGDLKDVISVSRWALKNKISKKLSIIGGSYGGYMTLWAMFNEPELYECGIAIASIADWEETLELSDFAFKNFFNMLFLGNKELMKERSPYYKCENLKKPLLIIHFQKDTRTHLKPVLKMIDKLNDLNKNVEVVIFPETGHYTGEREKIFKYYYLIFDFLRRNLGD
jgi:dipeptidyl aminopeptidase/acylaminoacyl peptidase